MSPNSRFELFRPEALAHAGSRRYGAVVLAHPLSFSLLTTLFVALAVAIVLFLACFSYTRKTSLPGVLLPTQGLIRVVPAQAGQVVEARVHEGQSVQAGQVLFVLSPEHAAPAQGSAGQTVEKLLETRRDSLLSEQSQERLQSRLRREALGKRVEDLAADGSRIAAQIGLQVHRTQLAEVALKRYEDLQKDNFVSPVQVQDKQAELLDQQQRLADLQRARAASARDLATAQADVRDLEVQGRRDEQAAERSIASSELELAENDTRREIIVRAPRAGIVSAVAAVAGQSVTPANVLAAITPAGSEMEAELYAPSRSAGFLHAGMPVSLRYQAYSYQKFGQSHGVVREVSRTALRPADLEIAGLVADTEPLYRVRVRLDRQTVMAYGENQPLRAGDLLDGSVVIDRRRLWEWVLEPLYTVTGRL
ncbi:HlyD family secretion protein [Scleromatobacter humisilvae]|uniref:HlyD family efflux transporter periplasmic adaptor subunit n=1 Tax=Scleromatobacter humisilvae TaxID=2897159 RepID=A0A9X1YKL5_9BURK|nr:HlyD family efflux transporter periplasmic adaptor subunit [Scleromatobacter humisilvae]MCK9686503.1 HlyD family efflux transporter periplasmic adaptor subunit [Scleromatobacter humisilvae]